MPSCVYSFWHGVIPTSYFIFNDFYTCFTNFLSRLSLDCSARRDDIITRTYVVVASVPGLPRYVRVLICGGGNKTGKKYICMYTRMRIVRAEVVTFTCNQDKMASV